MSTPNRYAVALREAAEKALTDEIKAEERAKATHCPCVGCREVEPNPYGCTRIPGKVEAVAFSAAYLERMED